MSSIMKKTRNMLEPSKIGVIVNGWPHERAIAVAKACHARGYKVANFGLATEDAKSSEIEVPDLGKINLVKFSAQDAKQKLEQTIADSRKEGLKVVVADVTENMPNNVKLYNELKIPFVLESSDPKVIQETEANKQVALITEEMDKFQAAFDEMFADFGRRFPSLWHDFDLDIRSTMPHWTSRNLLSSFGELIDKDVDPESVRRMNENEQKQMGHVQGQCTAQYSFRNGRGSSSFTFQSTSGDKENYSEGVADAVGFIAQKADQMTRPKVYNILDVARQPPMLGWL